MSTRGKIETKTSTSTKAPPTAGVFTASLERPFPPSSAMGGRWVAWVAVSALANSASAFVSCPAGGSTSCSSKITSSRYAAAQAGAAPPAGGMAPAAGPGRGSSSRRAYGRSGGRRPHAGALTALGSASSSFPQPLPLPSSRSGTRNNSCRRRRRRGRGAPFSIGMKTELETEVDGQEHAYEVVFVRHGQSTWNKANRFIGWTDAELTEEGEIEARVAGQVTRRSLMFFRCLFVFLLSPHLKVVEVI